MTLGGSLKLVRDPPTARPSIDGAALKEGTVAAFSAAVERLGLLDEAVSDLLTMAGLWCTAGAVRGYRTGVCAIPSPIFLAVLTMADTADSLLIDRLLRK